MAPPFVSLRLPFPSSTMPPINHTFLDALCLAHVSGLPPPPHPPSHPPPSSASTLFSPAFALEQAARLHALFKAFETGDAVLGTRLANALAPGVLDEAGFQLDVRCASLAGALFSDGLEAALEKARDVARFAEAADVDTYPRFVEEMVMFVLPERVGGDAGVRERWRHLGERAVASIRARAGARGGRLGFLVRYLMGFGSGGRFGLGRVWARPLRCPDGGAVDDGNVLALCERFSSLGREGAVDAMRWAGGDVNGALLAELARIEIEEGVLDDMVGEYLEARGLRGEGKMRRLRDVADRSAVDLIDAALDVLPSILDGREGLRFRFGQARLMHEVELGDFEGAVRVLKDVLAPLVEAPDGPLADELKKTAVLLVFPVEDRGDGMPVKKRRTIDTIDGDIAMPDADDAPNGVPLFAGSEIEVIRNAVAERCSAAALSAPIFRAVVEDAGQPALVKVLSDMLAPHAIFLSSSGMSKDQFGELLGIGGLLRDEDALVAVIGGESMGAGKADSCDSAGPEEADRERNLLMLMDFLQMSRAAALDILNENPNQEVGAIIDTLTS